LYKTIHHKVRINYYPPRGDNKEGWDNIDIFRWLGYPMQIKVDFLCRDRFLLRRSSLTWGCFLDLAQRAGIAASRSGSASTSNPNDRPGLYPEHDLFIQLMKLKTPCAGWVGRRSNHPSP